MAGSLVSEWLSTFVDGQVNISWEGKVPENWENLAFVTKGWKGRDGILTSMVILKKIVNPILYKTILTSMTQKLLIDFIPDDCNPDECTPTRRF